MVQFNPYAYETHDDPFPLYRALRDEAPCYRNDELGFWALSRYDDVVAALHDPETYCSRFGITLEDGNPLPMLLTTDPPAHTAMRRLVSRAFTPRRIAELETDIRALSTGYLDAISPGAVDLIADYAALLPMDVISKMLGVPDGDQHQLREWSDALLHREEGVPDVTAAGISAAGHLFKYFGGYVADRRAHPGGDDFTAALDRGRTRWRSTHRRTGGGVLLPLDHRRQRDHDEAARELPARVAALPVRASEGARRSRRAFPTPWKRRCATKARRK